MKVSVSYTEEYSDDERRAINAYYGAEGLAARDEIKHYLRERGTEDLADIIKQGQGILELEARGYTVTRNK